MGGAGLAGHPMRSISNVYRGKALLAGTSLQTGLKLTPGEAHHTLKVVGMLPRWKNAYVFHAQFFLRLGAALVLQRVLW